MRHRKATLPARGMANNLGARNMDAETVFAYSHFCASAIWSPNRQALPRLRPCQSANSLEHRLWRFRLNRERR